MFSASNIRPVGSYVPKGYRVLTDDMGLNYVFDVMAYYFITHYSPSEEILKEGYAKLERKKRHIDAVRLRRWAADKFKIEIAPPAKH